MKILLVTRGSQGDVLPYLPVAAELVKRGHEVTVNLPRIFEDIIKPYNLTYVLQDFDDIRGMIDAAAEKSQKLRPFLKWTREVIDMQFAQLTPLLEQHDLLVSTNSEFAVASIAEYCGKPLIRTAYAPFLPGKKIPPAFLPFPKPNPIITPGLLWKLMNRITNFMVRGTINKNRATYNLLPIKNFGYHAGQNSHNFLMFSRHLGEVDPDWQFEWTIGGYCFNDTFEYDKAAYEEMMAFVNSNDRPVIFFTLGSCNAKDGNRFCETLIRVCRQHDYRLIVGSGWSGTGLTLSQEERFFVMKHPVPHFLIFPHCTGVIHHGGCGTTHSVARAGVPQLITPQVIDQPYWSYRINQLGLGPEGLKIGKASDKEIERQVCDLVTNPLYKKKAAATGEKIRNEKGVNDLCDYIETFSKPSFES
ncbi:glycosyltransferase [Parabacteroides sp.]